MSREFKKFKKVPFILALTLLALSLGIFTYIYRATAKNVAESVEIEKKAQDEEQRIAEVEFLERSLSTWAPKINEFNSHFIKSSDVVPFLNLVEELGPKVGAKATVTQVDLPKDQSYLNVGVEAEGSFEALYKFLLLLENSPYELEIVSANISQNNEESEGLAAWSGTFKIKLLSFMP